MLQKHNINTKPKGRKSTSTFSWLDIISVTIISFLLVQVIFMMNPSRLLRISEESDSFTTDLFLHIENNSSHALKSDFISIVNIKNLQNRGEIAKVLENVYLMSPKCIGVDIDFVGLQDSVADSMLCSVVERIRDKTVFVCGIENENLDSISHSFFCDPKYPLYNIKDSAGVLSVKEGTSALIHDLSDNRNRTYQNCYFTKQGKYYSLTAKMYEDYLETPDDSIEHILTYKRMKFDLMSYDSLKEISIKDKFVLVGKIDDRQDIHNTPLGFLPGTYVHAHTLEALIDGRDIKETSNFFELLISIILSFLFCVSLFSIDLWADRCKGNNSIIKAYLLGDGGCAMILLTFFAVFFLLVFAYSLYKNFNILLKMHVALICVLTTAVLGKYVYNLFLLLISKYGKNWGILTELLLKHSYYYKRLQK